MGITEGGAATQERDLVTVSMWVARDLDRGIGHVEAVVGKEEREAAGKGVVKAGKGVVKAGPEALAVIIGTMETTTIDQAILYTAKKVNKMIPN